MVEFDLDVERDFDGYTATFVEGEKVLVVPAKAFATVIKQLLFCNNGLNCWGNVQVELSNGMIATVNNWQLIKVAGYCPSCNIEILEVNRLGPDKSGIQISHNYGCVLT